MGERKQPVNLGVDEKGELIWGEIPMPEWQRILIQKLVPIPYVGDFLAFWWKNAQYWKKGYEDKGPNLEFRKGQRKGTYHVRRHHSGD